MNDFLKVVLNEDNTLSLIVQNQELNESIGELGEQADKILSDLIEYITIKTNDIVLSTMKVDVESE